MAHLGNTYARMQYLESLHARQGGQKVDEEEPAQACPTILFMERGPSGSAHDDGAFVSEEAFEEDGPLLCAPPAVAGDSEKEAGPTGWLPELCHESDSHESSRRPMVAAARRGLRDPLPTIPVDVSESEGHEVGAGLEPAWGVPPGEHRRRDLQATIAVDLPDVMAPPRLPGDRSVRVAATPTPAHPDVQETIAVDVDEDVPPIPQVDPMTSRRAGAATPPRVDPHRTIAVEVPEAGLPPLRGARREAGTADPRQTLPVDLEEACPSDDELPADCIRMAAIRQVHANGKLMEKMRAALFR